MSQLLTDLIQQLEAEAEASHCLVCRIEAGIHAL